MKLVYVHKGKKKHTDSGMMEVRYILTSEFAEKKYLSRGFRKCNDLLYRHARVDAARFPAGGARSLEKRAVVGA